MLIAHLCGKNKFNSSPEIERPKSSGLKIIIFFDGHNVRYVYCSGRISCFCRTCCLRFCNTRRCVQTLCRSGSRTPAKSMMELFVKIVNYRLIANYYQKELHLRYLKGPRPPSAYTRRRFSNGTEFSH